MIENLPTDNYHKFCAISGLALCGFILFTLGSRALQVHESMLELGEEGAVLTAELEIISQRIDRLERIQKEPSGYSQDEIKDSIQKVREANDEQIVRSAKQNAKLYSIKANKVLLAILVVAGALGMALGSRLSKQGFKRWAAMQKLEDRKKLNSYNLASSEPPQVNEVEGD